MRRSGRNVIVLLVVSVVAALVVTRIFKLGVPSTVLSLLVGGGAPAGLYMTWRQTVNAEGADDKPPEDDPNGPTESVLDQLASTVRQQWEKEYEVRTYNDPAQKLRDIRASWSAADASLTVPWARLTQLARGGNPDKQGGDPNKWASGPEGLAGLDEGDLRGILEKVPTGWLVVLGGSGSGKTMLMLRTVREIIDNRHSDEPVPLFVPMTSWDPDSDTLRTWLEKRIPIDYPALGASITWKGKKTTLIGRLLAEQMIMPILDGLDEMPEEARVGAINQLNSAFTDPARPRRLIVTCRTNDYRTAVDDPGEEGDQEDWIPNPVDAAAVIELHPLDPDKVSSYLADRGNIKRWAGVNKRLMESGAALAKALNTPLYASLASEIYNPTRPSARAKRRRPEELCGFSDVQSVKHHLLDEFIPTVYAEERAALERQAEEDEEPGPVPAERWLMILAHYMTNRKDPTTSLEWWNLKGLAPRWLIPAAIGLICGIPTAVAAATGAHVGVGIGIGFGTGMLIAVAIGLAVFEARRRWDTSRLRRGRLSRRAYNNRYKKRRPGPGMTGGMIGAVLGGLGAGIAGKYHIGHQASLFSGIPEALGMALGAGANTDFFGGFTGVLVGAFVGGYLAAVGLGLPAGLVNGLGVGVAVALVIKNVGRRKPSRTRPTWDKPVGIAGGTVIGLAIGAIVWREAGPAYGVVFGLLMAVFAAAPFGLRHVDENLQYVPSPMEALDRDVRAFRFTALSAGLAAGMAGFLGGSMTSIFEVHGRATVGSVIGDGLGIGVASGLVVGMTFGFYHAASPEFRIITWWLAMRRKAPLRFKRFLAQAYDLTVLRQTGATYQFRHIELQQRLAARFKDGDGQHLTSDPQAVAAVATGGSSPAASSPTSQATSAAPDAP